MATLAERIQKQLADLQAERDRIEADAKSNLAEVDLKIAALTEAARAVTKEIEVSYVALLKFGLIREV